jgi:hypothetical protein
LSAEALDWLTLLSGESDGEITLPVLSGSMADALLPGDLLTVRPMGREKAHAGDIVVFRDSGKLVAHRLIFAFRLSSLALLLEKGDANGKASNLKPNAIVGRVISARRRGVLVLEMDAETRRRGRRLAARGLMWHLLYVMPKDFLKGIFIRDA